MKTTLTRSASVPSLSTRTTAPSLTRSNSTSKLTPPSKDSFEHAPAQRPPAPTAQQLQQGRAALKRTEGTVPPHRPTAPTAQQLQDGKAALKRTDYGTVHPELDGIRTRRDGLAAHEFADFTTDVRASTHQLMSQPNGARLMRELNGRTAAVNPGAVGTKDQPLTVADIVKGDTMKQSPRYDPHNLDLGEIRKAYRYDGTPGAGQASKITYNPDQMDARRFNSLGHEGTHAWRAANGVAVSPPLVSPMSNAPVLKIASDDGSSTVEDFVQRHSHMREEFETVGLRPTPHSPNPDGWAPNENLIRQEHGMPRRNDYSGRTPEGEDARLKSADEATDDRSWLKKTFSKEPSPVQKVINHLEQ